MCFFCFVTWYLLDDYSFVFYYLPEFHEELVVNTSFTLAYGSTDKLVRI